MRVIDEVFTTKEASERWNVAQYSVKRACTGQKGYPPRFNEDEFKKSGDTWLVTRSGMERLYGKEKAE